MVDFGAAERIYQFGFLPNPGLLRYLKYSWPFTRRIYLPL